MVAQSQLENQLDVFNQKKYITEDKRILDFTGDTSDPLVARMVNRLEQALLDEEMLRVMRAEEEVENAFYKKVMEIQKLQEKFEEERQAKEEERQAKEEERQAKERFALEIEILKQQIEAFKKQLEQKNDA
jgi:DNA gyrase/topoisomerase IV subunit B